MDVLKQTKAIIDETKLKLGKTISNEKDKNLDLVLKEPEPEDNRP